MYTLGDLKKFTDERGLLDNTPLIVTEQQCAELEEYYAEVEMEMREINGSYFLCLVITPNYSQGV